MHCKAGHGRAAAVALAWMLHENPNARPEDLNALLCKKRKVLRVDVCVTCVYVGGVAGDTPTAPPWGGRANAAVMWCGVGRARLVLIEASHVPFSPSSSEQVRKTLFKQSSIQAFFASLQQGKK